MINVLVKEDLWDREEVNRNFGVTIVDHIIKICDNCTWKKNVFEKYINLLK